ncbi:transposase [Nonomuraea sp. SYSU D8015]|uniref:transposase n=1 Tax=Nonomuraea sp. SYSU D8015 TaxID=2593644 RepID=UPI003FA5818A
MPERYGPWQACYERFKRWEEDGTWARLLEEARRPGDRRGRATSRDRGRNGWRRSPLNFREGCPPRSSSNAPPWHAT